MLFRSDDFYQNQYGIIFDAMVELCNEGDFYIDVEDNGCGMSQQQVASINQRFRKPEQPEDGNRMAEGQEDTKVRKGQGGIGLGNVNKRIKMFCGEEYGLKVISTPEVGTQIVVCLPLYKEAREE